MVLHQTTATFQTAVAAAGLELNVDLAAQSIGPGAHCEVMPLTMRGLRYLRWTLHLDVPPADLAILQCNILARMAGIGMAWPQT